MAARTTRRVMHAEVSQAFTAWLECWEARTAALATVRRAANRFHAPELKGCLGRRTNGQLRKKGCANRRSSR